ncbi:hypothetical protein BC826DRAFT_640573 [Russula brevipes]|nr:hypothetical protein BC826DRAFT_640573 [Russula brevipes]
MPHLEVLAITFYFSSPGPNPEVEWQHATLPILRYFLFEGTSAYLEALLPRMAAPLLEQFHIGFVVQSTSVPCLLQFINATEGFRFSRAKLSFEDSKVRVVTKPREASWKHVFSVALPSFELDRQVSSLVELFDALSPAFAAVEHLSLEYREHTPSSETRRGRAHKLAQTSRVV